MADDCLQIHGGAGYMREYGIERAWRDLRLNRIGAGTDEIMLEVIGRSLRPVSNRRRALRAKIGLVDSVRGQLLIAGPTLEDPNFWRTVVLVVEHSEEGALGLVLNRPSESTVARGGAASDRACRPRRRHPRGRAGQPVRGDRAG